jgi:hypothetical protein
VRMKCVEITDKVTEVNWGCMDLFLPSFLTDVFFTVEPKTCVHIFQRLATSFVLTNHMSKYTRYTVKKC